MRESKIVRRQKRIVEIAKDLIDADIETGKYPASEKKRERRYRLRLLKRVPGKNLFVWLLEAKRCFFIVHKDLKENKETTREFDAICRLIWTTAKPYKDYLNRVSGKRGGSRGPKSPEAIKKQGEALKEKWKNPIWVRDRFAKLLFKKPYRNLTKRERKLITARAKLSFIERGLNYDA